MPMLQNRSFLSLKRSSSHNLYEDMNYDLHHTTKLVGRQSCRVCGDEPAKMHYGVPTCFGCKGFFRRTLKRTKEYACKNTQNCVVDKHERNACRYCRFKRCLEVGMDPNAVRPDRDTVGTRGIRPRVKSAGSFSHLESEALVEEQDPHDIPQSDEWIKKLPVDMRTLLMQMMNIEVLVTKSDTHKDPHEVYPLDFRSLKEILESPSRLNGKRTQIMYETFRNVLPEEILLVAHRSLIEIIDYVNNLFSIMGINNVDDKLTVIKSSYAGYTILAFSAATAKNTNDPTVCCMCNLGCVRRGQQHNFDELYHLGNKVIDHAIDELVIPLRNFRLSEQEFVLLKGIIALNPHIKNLSQETADHIAELRDHLQETLYNVVRESHPREVASTRFGNMLLFIPTIMMLGNVMYENLQFVHTFGKLHNPLLNELLDNIDPLEDLGTEQQNQPEVMQIESPSSESMSSINFALSPISENGEKSKKPIYSMAQASLPTNPFQSPPHTIQTPPQSSYESLLSSNPAEPQRPSFFINTDPNQPEYACSFPQNYFMQPVQPMDQFNTYPNFYANGQQLQMMEQGSSSTLYQNNNFNFNSSTPSQRIPKSFSTPCHQTMLQNYEWNGQNGGQF